MSPEEIDGALAGERTAMDALVRRLRPVIQSAVAFALLPLAKQHGRDPRQELLDLVQDVLVSLLADEGKILRRWDPARGSSLESFVRLIARRHVAAVVRSRRRSPYTHEPASGETLDLHPNGASDLDRQVEVRRRLDHLLDELQHRLDERGLMLFEMLYVNQCPVDDACAATGMTRDAVYAWRSRLRRQLGQLTKDDA